MPITDYKERDQSGLADRIKWNFKLAEDASIPKCCPYCGSDEFYRKVTFTGRSEVNYRFDGTAADNSTLHDGVNYHEQRSVYCRNCERKLGSEIPS